MFVLFFTSSDLKLWLGNNTSIYENSDSNVFEINFWGEISNNWWNNILRLNVYRALEVCS